MPKLESKMEGNRIIFHIEIESNEKNRNWCVVVCSRSNYAGGFTIPTIASILEYPYKVDTFCGKESQTIKKEYMMPGEYLAILGVGSTGMVEARGVEAVDESAREIGYITTKFEITGLAITDKDVNSARAILSCMADVHNENKKKGEKVFDNMMLEPMFSTIVELLNNVVEKRDISLYTDLIKYNITLTGPIIKEGKYFWPMIREGKYVEYRE